VKPSLEEESSSKALDGVTSPEGSDVNPETCKNIVLAKEDDLVEVTTDIDNHAKANKICEHPFLFSIPQYYPLLSNIIQGDLDQGLIAYSL
jgi:hypothetical protein